MKILLTLASVSAIQCDQELKQYYKKKVSEGKPKTDVSIMLEIRFYQELLQ
jgi:hypothetical protein